MALIQQYNLGGRKLKTAIAGFSIEGSATLRYLRRHDAGDRDITILDQREVTVSDDSVATDFRPDVFEGELNYDEIWRTPSLNPHRLKVTGMVTSLTKEFFARCPAPIIGVTGSKGKGTTASLISSILKQAGFKTHLVGNIGVPALDELDNISSEDIVVYELSSFQLWDMDRSPDVAVVLMIEPEHLDVHDSLDDYVQAKSNIARWQTSEQLTIHHPTNELTARAAKVGLGQKLAFLSDEAANIDGEQLVIDGHTICSVSEFGLIGEHNHENITAAVTAAWQFTQDVAAIAHAVIGFKGLSHRLQLIGEKQGVTYVDDSIATTPSAAVAAIRAFYEPKILLLGGSSKGADFSDLAGEVVNANVKRVLVYGQEAPKLIKALESVGYDQFEQVEGSMNDIVARAAEAAEPGDVVLLSPACASFDMFKDYVDRAQQFASAVTAL